MPYMDGMGIDSIDFYGKVVGKYTYCPMDGLLLCFFDGSEIRNQNQLVHNKKLSSQRKIAGRRIPREKTLWSPS